jgi:hypothetical protein
MVLMADVGEEPAVAGSSIAKIEARSKKLRFLKL